MGDVTAILARPVLLDNTVLTNLALVVGILVLCVRRGHLSREQADALLTEMITLGYRSPVASLDPLLDES